MIENNCGYEYFGKTKLKITYLKDCKFNIDNKIRFCNAFSVQIISEGCKPTCFEILGIR